MEFKQRIFASSPSGTACCVHVYNTQQCFRGLLPPMTSWMVFQFSSCDMNRHLLHWTTERLQCDWMSENNVSSQHQVPPQTKNTTGKLGHLMACPGLLSIIHELMKPSFKSQCEFNRVLKSKILNFKFLFWSLLPTVENMFLACLVGVPLQAPIHLDTQSQTWSHRIRGLVACTATCSDGVWGKFVCGWWSPLMGTLQQTGRH